MPRERKMPSGMIKRGRVYHAQFRAAGRMVRRRLSSDFRTACELLNDLRARADRADFGKIDNDCLWSDLKAEFVRWARQAVRRPEDYEADLKRFENYTPIRSVRQISTALVTAYREWRLGQSVVVRTRKTGAAPLARKVSPRTVNREVGTLNNLLNKAVEWRRIGFNPIAGLKPLRHDKPIKQRRPLTTGEVLQLIDASPDYLKPVWRAFACTGLRLAELQDLRFSDIDFEIRVLTVRAAVAKSKRPRTIPLDDQLFDAIHELRAAAKHRRPVAGKTAAETASQAKRFSRDHVFVTTTNTPHRAGLLKLFYAACKRAGIEDAGSGGAVDLHSLRVSFATLALENGASPKAVQELLGHSTLKMTMEVYAKATERAKREAITALPFGNSSSPEHVISVQNVHRMYTTKKSETQPLAVKALANTGA